MQNIFFVCQYDQCNSEQIFREVTELVDEYYDLSPIRNVLANIKNENTTVSKQSSTTIVMTMINTTMKNNGLQLYCSNTVIYGVLIIFIFHITFHSSK